MNEAKHKHKAANVALIPAPVPLSTGPQHSALTLFLLVPDLDDLVAQAGRGEQGAVPREGHVVHGLGGAHAPETLPHVVSAAVLGLPAHRELHVPRLAWGTQRPQVFRGTMVR